MRAHMCTVGSILIPKLLLNSSIKRRKEGVLKPQQHIDGTASRKANMASTFSLKAETSPPFSLCYMGALTRKVKIWFLNCLSFILHFFSQDS